MLVPPPTKAASNRPSPRQTASHTRTEYAARSTSPSSWMATAAGRRSAGLPRQAGYRAGTENIRRLIQAFAERGVAYLTLFAFSTENWKRPQARDQPAACVSSAASSTASSTRCTRTACAWCTSAAWTPLLGRPAAPHPQRHRADEGQRPYDGLRRVQLRRPGGDRRSRARSSSPTAYLRMT